MSTFGNILVTSDAQDVTKGDAVVLSGSDGSLVNTISTLPFSSRGDRLVNGTLAMTKETSSANSHVLGIEIFDSNITLIADVTTIPFTPPWDAFYAPLRASSSSFYVSSSTGGGGTAAKVHNVSATGVVGTTWTLPLPGGGVNPHLICMSPTPDDTVLYYSHDQSPGIMRVWDLVNSTALPNFVTLGSMDHFGEDVFVLSNGDILVMVALTGGTNWEIRRYNSSAVLQSTISLGAAGEFEQPELFRDVSTDNIWCRSFPDATGHTSTFTKYQISTGTALTTFTVSTLEGSGVVPSTCPNFVLGDASGGGDNVFVGTAQIVPIRWQRTLSAPVLDGNLRQVWRRLEVQIQPGLGVTDEPLSVPTIQVRMSWDNGKSYQNEQLMSLGREGAYVTRAFLVSLGSGRWPVVELVGNDASNYVLTGLFAWVDEGSH